MESRFIGLQSKKINSETATMSGLPLLSICVPSYNRPEELSRLFSSVDCDPDTIEIVVCEDCAPSREQVRKAVEDFQTRSKYVLRYEENLANLGYDANLRRLIEIASGEFVLFMGDDDWFNKGALDQFLEFLKANRDVGYVLRSYLGMHPDGKLEPFRYLNGPKRFPAGLSTCAWMYKRTVSICGVTFKRESALKYSSDRFDGSLLYQLYLVLEVCYREPSVYSNIPVAIAAQTYREDKPQFGAAAKEKGKFQPGKVTVDNSINFSKGFFQIARSFDDEHCANLIELITTDLSRYSYPFLSIQRKRGVREFLTYAHRLAIETGMNATWHYYFYTFSLLIFGERICDLVIFRIKQRLGHTPSF